MNSVCSCWKACAGGRVRINTYKKASGNPLAFFSLSKKEGTSKGLHPPFGEKSGKEEGKEERGVVPGAV